MKNKDKEAVPPEENSEASTTEPTSENVVEKLQKELEQAKQEQLYLRADMENTRKRLVRNQEQQIQFANEKILLDLVPVIDIFERALKVAKDFSLESEQAKNFVTGVEATYKGLRQALEKHGVKLVGEVGEVFDPNIHEAISQVESDKEPGRIDQVFQLGTQLHGRLLNPAKVVVTKSSQTNENEE